MNDGTRINNDLRTRRESALAPSYQLFYDDPVHLVCGEDVWVTDVDGNQLLDCYNNVPSVGHAHPRVVAALAGQAAQLNTHTRYLHEEVVRLAERLGSMLPDGLQTCFFVCTGTEANDLAVEIARTVTGQHGVVVSEHSYHGNSSLVSLLSTDSYPAALRPDWLGVIDAPNDYRGRFRADDPDLNGPDLADPDGGDLGERYADLVTIELDALNERGHRPAAWLVDPSWDSNGVLVAPDGYVEQYPRPPRHEPGRGRRARRGRAGAKEGLARRPGAGHRQGERERALRDQGAQAAAPAAHRRHQARRHRAGPGRAVANSVLDVIEDQQLLRNASAMGIRLSTQLTELAARHNVIGNVQGGGLFWGLDLVADRGTRTPIAYDDGRRLATELRHDGILIGLTGPHTNVLKIRPPLTFSSEHVDRLVEVLDVRLAKFELRGGSERRQPSAES